MNYIYILTFAVITLLSATVSNAQELVTHPKQKYISADGTLYWPGVLPVYVFVADNPDGNNSEKLNVRKNPNNANPMYLDSEGINFIRKQWAANAEGQLVKPQQEILFEIYRDSNAPVTTVSSENNNFFQAEGTRYYGEGQPIILSAKDQYSGVRAIYVSINGSPYQAYTGTIKAESDGNYEVKYYAVDNVGNQEEVKTYTFIRDTSAPTSSLTVNGEKLQAMLAPRAKIALQSSDKSANVQEIRYSIDGKAEKKYSGELSLTSLEDGDHNITYYAIDNTNNKEETKTYSFYLDKTAPEVSPTIVGDQYQSRGRVFVSTRSKVKLDAIDNKSGVKRIYYTINGGAEKTYTEPFDLPKTNGKYEIRFFAIDNVGNTFETVFDETKHGRKALDLDMVVPEINFNYAGKKYFMRDTSFITSKTLIELNAKDDDSGVNSIGYKINSGEGMTFTEGISLPEEGIYLIDYFATDNVNNRNIDQFFFIVDNTGPTIQTIWSMSQTGTELSEDGLSSVPVYSSGVKLYLASTDNMLDTETIYYTLNTSTEKVYSLPIVLETKGVNNILVKAIDRLGNESTYKTIKVFIK